MIALLKDSHLNIYIQLNKAHSTALLGVIFICSQKR